MFVYCTTNAAHRVFIWVVAKNSPDFPLPLVRLTCYYAWTWPLISLLPHPSPNMNLFPLENLSHSHWVQCCLVLLRWGIKLISRAARGEYLCQEGGGREGLKYMRLRAAYLVPLWGSDWWVRYMILVKIYHRVENGDSQSHRVKVTECAVRPNLARFKHY